MGNTTDTPTNLAILPDWKRRVTLTEQWDTNLTRSFGGKGQSSSKRVRPTYRLEYTRAGLTAAESRRRLLAVRAEFEVPLIVPIWLDGAVLSGDMTLVTGNDRVPLGEIFVNGYDLPFVVYIWTEAAGGEFRTVTSFSGATLTLDGSGTLYAAGAHCFPCRLAVRELDSEALNLIDAETGVERVRFLTL
jgi:hypothetical protein